jgi:hypothetical protein
MKKLDVMLACLLWLGLLSGCEAQTGPGAEAPKTAVETDQAVIVYQRSGGLLGGSESWSFYDDGRVVHTGRGGEQQSARIGAEEVAALVEAIHALGFSDLKESYLSNQSCRDCYRYTINVRQADGTYKQVETQDAEPGAPLALTQIIEQLNLAIEAAR